MATALSLARRLSAPYHAVRSMSIAPPERLRIAPPEIRTADPTVADQIAAGYYTFAGKTARIQGVSPFHVRPPSADWRRKLTGFSWLRHLRAADEPQAREAAKALVAEFLAIQKFERGDSAMEPAVVARRLLSFLAQSPSLLDGATPEFYDAFMAALAQHARLLWRALASDGVFGAPRALCAIALVEYAVCADDGRKIAAQASRALTDELDLQILSDGGHISRNPQSALDLLLDLLPLRQVIAARGLQAPPALVRAIDRIAPFMRMLQHGEGSLALFNGMGATAIDRLTNALAFEDTRGAAPVNAPYAGYQRVEAKDALLLVDAGRPPPVGFSREAHAGCLSFEYSLGGERVIVNCGAPASQHQEARELARGGAAHST
ncbi:MAG: heparinase II/III family protein, partial [Methylocystis sp.]|nr:heparinase II/III family protein [Methylocystis sp.]